MNSSLSIKNVKQPNRFSVSGFVATGLVIGLLTALLAALTTLSPRTAAGVAGFGDVDDGHYYTEAVQWAADEGIVDADACFWPESPVTRGDAAMALWRMQGSPQADAHSFADVLDPTQNDAVSWLSSTGVTTGTSETTFAPTEPLNRGHIATFLWRLAGEPKPAEPHPFADVHAGWQEDAVSWLFSTGVTTGTSATEFSPGLALNRAQLVTFLYRYSGKPAVTVDRRTPYCDPSSAPLISLAAGDDHLCGLRFNDVVDCWGNNKSGQSSAPNARFTAVSARGLVSCGILTDGTVRCWGNSGNRQLDVPDGIFTAISVGAIHVCGIRESGEVACWGSGAAGVDPPAGRFTTISAGASSLTCGLRIDGKPECWSSPRWQPSADWDSTPPAGRFVAFEAVDGTQACGLRDYGVVQCWGWGYREAPMQRNVPEGVFTAISQQSDHVCGLRVNGTAECWSTSAHNTDGHEFAPRSVFTDIAAGSGFTCGLRVDASVECWYSSAGGPAAAPEGSYTAVSAKGRAACGVLSEGAAVCWGDRGSGPKLEALQGAFTAVAAGDDNVCGILENGALKCTVSSLWQDPPSGEFTAVSGGDLSNWQWCGLREDGVARCWGRGADVIVDSQAPEVLPEGVFRALSSGEGHWCGLRDDGRVECWGQTGSYWCGPQGCEDTLGHGWWDVPESRFTSVSAGGRYSCGILSGGAVECWTAADPRLGLRAVESGVPEERFNAISAGVAHACGILRSGAAECWGSNDYGESNAPAGQFSAISAGDYRSCGLREDGRVECWGLTTKLWGFPGIVSEGTVGDLEAT
ncbi:MAG: S-layer homology domain-containing protein [Acidimicrobiaceae bacterium]|nr:S-layer homology domain-containing protein [Acidimicrobiaceae bacterium]